MKEISAGGVVYRQQDDQLYIQLIQDRYGKLSLAKGKMETGETVEQTALREILEETGISGMIVAPLEIIAYTYKKSHVGYVDKEVHYYLIKAISGELRAQTDEIRGVEWLEPLEAWKQQLLAGYDNNSHVLRKALLKLGYEVE